LPISLEVGIGEAGSAIARDHFLPALLECPHAAIFDCALAAAEDDAPRLLGRVTLRHAAEQSQAGCGASKAKDHKFAHRAPLRLRAHDRAPPPAIPASDMSSHQLAVTAIVPLRSQRAPGTAA
jgi:hypothetical protein